MLVRDILYIDMPRNICLKCRGPFADVNLPARGEENALVKQQTCLAVNSVSVVLALKNPAKTS